MTTITPDAARKLARSIISKKLQVFCGMGIDDVPDTPQLCDLCDELQGMIEENIKDINTKEFRIQVNVLINYTINEDTIEELIL